MVNFTAVYVLWLRELIRYSRAKSRMISSLVMPVLFLLAFGTGLRSVNIAGIPENVDYMAFLIPGIIGMTLMSSSVMSGLSVLWDREFGFLKEIMVAPVDRLSIVLGRIAGGVITSVIQGLLIFTLSLLLGLKIHSFYSLAMALTVIFLISISFVGLGLIFSSLLKDMQGFGAVMNLIVMPLLLLSGAFFPISNLPWFVKVASYMDPLTYGVDGLRAALMGFSNIALFTDIGVLTLISVVFLTIGTILFERSESA